MMEAELFDGTVLEFPDGTDQSVIQRVVREQTAAKRGATPAEDKRDQSGVPGGTAVTTQTPVQPAADDGFMSSIMSGLDYVDDTIAGGLTGARQGVSAVLGLPVDAVNNAPRIANLLPGVDGVGPISDNPVLGSRFIDMIMGAPTDLAAAGYNAGAEALGSDSRVSGSEGPIPQDFIQRGARRVGQELGAAAVPVGGALLAAGRMGVNGARAMGGPIGNYLESAAINPSVFAGKEAAVATGAGTGAAVANEIIDPTTSGGQLADLLGALFGAGLTGVGGALSRGVRDVGSAFTGNPNYASRVVGDNVADTLIRNSDVMNRQVDPMNLTAPLDTQALIDAIRRPSQAEELVPGFRASTADHAGDAGLASLEAARARANPGPYRQRADQNAMAVEDTIAGMRPDESPAALREALDLERNRRVTEAGTLARTAEDELLAAITGVQPGMADATARGSTARAALEDAYQAARRGVDEAYRPINEADIPVNAVPLAERFAATTDNLPLNDRQRFLPSEARLPEQFVTPGTDPTPTGILGPDGQPIMRPGEQPSGEVPLREITSIRSGLTDDVRAARAAPGQAQKARVADQYRQQTDQFLDEAVPPELRQQYDTARNARRDLADRFERPGTALQRVLQRREGGAYQMDDSAVTRQFTPTNQGNLTDFRDAIREAGTDTRLRSAIADEVVTEAQRMGVMEKPDALRKFLDDRSIVLEQFPELRQKLGTVADRKQAVDTARSTETDLQRELGTDTQPGRGTVGRYLQFSDANAEKAISEVMAARDPGKAADELLTFVGDDPAAVQGARAAFWKKLEADSRSKNENATTESGIAPWMPRKMLSFLDDPAKAAVAERLYKDDPQHLADIRTLANALRSVNTGAKVGNATNPSGTALMMKGQPPVTLAEVGSKGYQAQTGRASWAYIGTYLAGKVARGVVGRQRAKAFELLLDKALTDKDVASSLLLENNPANRAALARKAKGWLGNEASTFVDLMNEEDDDTKRETMRAIDGR